jgi:hypothetical protein
LLKILRVFRNKGKKKHKSVRNLARLERTDIAKMD